MTKTTKDPALEAVRRVRHEISEEMGHDPKRLLEYYRQLETEYADRIVHSTEVDTPEPLPPGPVGAGNPGSATHPTQVVAGGSPTQILRRLRMTRGW